MEMHWSEAGAYMLGSLIGFFMGRAIQKERQRNLARKAVREFLRMQRRRLIYGEAEVPRTVVSVQTVDWLEQLAEQMTVTVE